jgi:phage terminase Nu1 subunit (DNA packaging protein)
LKTYTTKPNARRAARKAGVDPELVRETADGKFMIDTPPPATIEKGQIDLPTLSWLFDCTARQIQKLAKRGIVVRIASGLFDEKASIRNYVRHLREQAAGRVGQDPATDGVAANVKWKETNTQLIQLRLDREAGELVAVHDVSEAWARIMRGIRQFVLSLPGKIAFEIPTLTAHDRGVVERICRDGLTDASLERGFDMSREMSGSVDDHVLPDS